MNKKLVGWCLRDLQKIELWSWSLILTTWNSQIGDDPEEKEEAHGERQLPQLAPNLWHSRAKIPEPEFMETNKHKS